MTEARPTDPWDPGDAFTVRLHHPSHDKLITRVDPSGDSASIDAIVVPTARPAANLREALRLARELDCPILALCSGKARRTEVISAARDEGARTIAVDVAGVLMPPGLKAGAVAASVTPDGKYADLSLKRNIGLLVARMTDGWRRILFLDDDLRDVDVAAIHAAAAQLDDYAGIGLEVVGQRDNSVVCHAFRDVGGPQSTFVGGGALLVPTHRRTSHFPEVFNEDWFFLLDGEKLGRVGQMGSARQEVYDPYADLTRARIQEFGDCLAEGIFALLDVGRSVSDADLSYWEEYLGKRRRLIEEIVARLPTVSNVQRRVRIGAAMATAAETLATIEPRHCMRFLDAWREDQLRWSNYTDGLPYGLGVVDALTHLGLTDVRHTLANEVRRMPRCLASE